MNLKIVLEDGSEFAGKSFGAVREGALGELVFFTGMTGYQEVLSDPSYCDQMVCMTYPMIGNYGINREDYESLKPYLSAMIVNEYCDQPSNWRSHMGIDQSLKDFGIPGVYGVDTRALTKKIRSQGSMKAVLQYEGKEIGKDSFEFNYTKDSLPVPRVSTKQWAHTPGTGKRILILDFGVKKGIVKELVKRNCDVLVVPWNTNREEIKKWSPDGILLSNGPGDPRDLPEVVEEVRYLRDNYPVFGICLGHQLLALSYGLEVIKLKFGHHGANHPVYDNTSDKTYISSQNHNYAVCDTSLEKSGLKMTHYNLNDKSVEGFRDPNKNIFSVQYHPEANPGPQDSSYLFDQFLAEIDAHWKGARNG